MALGAVCSVSSGGTPSRATAANFGGGIPWVKSGEVDQAIVLTTEETISEAGVRSSAAQVVKAGAVLVAMYGATAGAVGALGIDAATNQAVAAVVPLDAGTVDAKYLRHFLQSKTSEMKRLARGGAQPNLNLGMLRELTIPIPPIEEQRRIAAILDKAEEIRAKSVLAQEHTKDAEARMFASSFGDDLRTDSRWPFQPIGAHAEVKIGPFGSLLHKSDYTFGGTPFVNPTHIVQGRIVPDERDAVSRDSLDRLAKYILQEGDVVLGRRGEMGRCAVVTEEAAGFLCGSGSAILRPRSTLDPHFLQSVLSSHRTRMELQNRSQGVTMANLNSSILEELQILVPPIAEQRNFRLQLETLRSVAASQARRRASCHELFASVQRRVFRGEL